MSKIKLDYTENIIDAPVEVNLVNSTMTLKFDDVLLPASVKISTDKSLEIADSIYDLVGYKTNSEWEDREYDLLKTIEDLEEILQAKEDLIDHLKCRENYMNVPF